MDTNLIQTLWVWWGTVPSDFKFLMLLPFGIAGTTLLVDALQRLMGGEGPRLPLPPADASAVARPIRAEWSAVAKPPAAHTDPAPAARQQQGCYSCTRDPSSMTQLLGNWK